MWGMRKRKAAKMRGDLGAFLSEGSQIEGKYTCAGTVMLDARLDGEIMARDTLIIGERAVVRASVQATCLVVHGELVGNVTASERVELRHGSRVTGDIESPVIVMEEGAVHDGQCRMTKATPSEAPLALVVPMKA